MAALDAAYRTAGFDVQVLDAEGRKGHLLVTFPLGGTYRVDVLEEPLNHPVVWMDFGPVIALADTVALKMGALHDRALPRDVLDAHGAAARFTRAELIAACRGRSMRTSAWRRSGISSPSPQRTRTRLSPVTVQGRNSSPR